MLVFITVIMRVKVSFTIRVRLLVSISCVDETGGTVMLVLQLHMETCRLAKRTPSSCTQKKGRQKMCCMLQIWFKP